MSQYVDQKDTKHLKVRITFLLGIVSFVFLIIIIRLWYLQLIKDNYYKRLAENNRIRLAKISAPRGIVFDADNNRLIENRPGFDIILVREDIKDWARLKKVLPSLVNIARDDMDRKLNKAKNNPPYQPIKLKHDIDWNDAAKIEIFQIDLPGISLAVSPRRLYPRGGIASHLLGYIGEVDEDDLKRLEGPRYSAGDMIGKYGIENSWDEYLRGINGSKQVEVDATGRGIGLLKQVNPIPGNNIHLTIDLHTQDTAAKVMEGKSGAIVALDPNNGKIKAMFSSPSFDPNLFIKGLTQEEWERLIKSPFHILTNKTIQGQYPPASTLKPIVAAALLEERIVSPSTFIYSGPSFSYGDRVYRDWKQEGHGEINIYRAIVESSDTFFYQTGVKLGIDKLSYYLKRFGLDKPTGIDLRDEKHGLVPSRNWKRKVFKDQWYDGDTILASIGQGYMLATPLQIANAYAAIANGGTLFKPQLVDRVETPEGKVISEFEARETGTLPVSTKTLRLIRQALAGVVHDSKGTARGIRMDDLKIAGKTGTAQVVRLGEERKRPEELPYKLRDHAWFVGYAPAHAPKIVVCVLVEHGGFGSETAAPLAREVIKAYLRLENTTTAGSNLETHGDNTVTPG